jgi:hypothetical protein
MCFEFEALYWAKLAEEEDKRRQADEQRKAPASQPQKEPAYEQEPLPV